MNLKEILTHKAEIIEIAKRLGFTGLSLHNVGAPWMHEDSDGNLPLALVVTSGDLINKAECCSRLELLLNCEVDIVIESPGNIHSQYLRNSVLLSDEDLEAKLAKLFGVPLEEMTFTPLDGVNRMIAESHIRKKDSQTMMFQGPQIQPVAFPTSAQQIEIMTLSFMEDFNVFLQQHFSSLPKEAREPMFSALEQQYPQVKSYFLDGSSGNTSKLLV